MTKRNSSHKKSGKGRKRSSGGFLRLKKNHPFTLFLFWMSVAVISFLVYRTYSRNVDTFKFIKRPSAAKKSTSVSGPVLASPYASQKATEVSHVMTDSTASRPILRPHVSLPDHSMTRLADPVIKKTWSASNRIWTSKPKIAFVIDDMGNKRRNEHLFRALGPQVTYAILPKVPYATHFSKFSLETGAQVILHQPLESEIGKNPGPGLIRIDMPPEEIRSLLDENLREIPEHIGINNHMGSLGSADERVMREILKDLKRRGMFFLDSHTTPNFVSRKIAKSIDLPVLMRDVFLDNVDQPDYIRGQLNDVRSIARRQGYAIAIGHDRENTLSVLIQDIPKLESEGFQIVFLTELIDHGVGLS